MVVADRDLLLRRAAEVGQVKGFGRCIEGSCWVSMGLGRHESLLRRDQYMRGQVFIDMTDLDDCRPYRPVDVRLVCVNAEECIELRLLVVVVHLLPLQIFTLVCYRLKAGARRGSLPLLGSDVCLLGW